MTPGGMPQSECLAPRLAFRRMKHALRTPEAWQGPLGDYLDWLSAAKAPPTTIKLRSYHLRRFATRSPLPPFEHTLDTLIGYLAAQNLSSNTIRSFRTTLKSFYAWARHTGRVRRDPARRLPKIPAPIGKPRPAPAEAVLRGVRDHDARTRLMIMLAAYGGLRCCEIARVHTRDLHEDLVGWSLIVHGKGNKQRVVPLRDDLAHLLCQIPSGYAFPGRIDGHLSAPRVSELISEALPVNVTAHMLRHWFASKSYVQSGNDIRAVQELLGHASVATTQIYTAVDTSALRRAVEFAA